MSTSNPFANSHELASYILDRGIPATVLTDAGLLPCLIVRLSSKHESFLVGLTGPFGGVFMRESPDDFLWICYGHGAAAATQYVFTLLPSGLDTRNRWAAEAWRSLANLVSIWITSPADRSIEAHNAMQRDADSIAYAMKACIGRYSGLVASAEYVIEEMLANGQIDELRVPYEEQATTIPMYLDPARIIVVPEQNPFKDTH